MNTKDSILDSIAKINSFGASEEEITSNTDNAYNNFAKYTKTYAPGIVEKVKINIARV